MARTQILGLDVGSTSVKAVVAEPTNDGKLALIKGFTCPSKGVRRGAVVDMDGVVGAIGNIFDDVAEVSKSALKNIYFNVNSADATVRISHGNTAVSRASSEIHADDIVRAVEASVVPRPRSNKMNLHVLDREFIVDGVGDIQDPIGMVGAKLEVVNLIVEAFEPSVRNLEKCIKMAGGAVGGMVFSPLSSAKSVLTDNQLELGVVLIDIGGSTTGIAVYEEGKLLHTKVFKVGANYITNDLALALEIPPELAEKIKIAHGYALAKEVTSRENIDLKKFDSDISRSPSKRFVAEVIEARLSEICEVVNDELKSIGKERNLPGGVVVVGGGAKMPGVADLVQRDLRMATQIGAANGALFVPRDASTRELIESPEYTCALGLPLHSDEMKSRGRAVSPIVIPGFFGKIWESFRP
ncbi:MAG: cell division protein FtsA [Candidatus Colwellbacteria bacterium]|nr:cell division protein FtsA [Candidatus Colwellbacteria bacterium]